MTAERTNGSKSSYGKLYYDLYQRRYLSNTKYNRRKEFVIASLKPRNGELILDLGCGTGAYSTDILDRNAKLFSLDISADALQLAKSYYGIPNGVQADATKLPFRNEVFDKILTVTTIEHIEDTIGFLREILRCLKKNGVLCLETTPIKSDILYSIVRSTKTNPILRKLLGLHPLSEEKHHNAAIQHPKKLRSNLTSIGFEIEEEKYWNILHFWAINDMWFNSDIVRLLAALLDSKADVLSSRLYAEVVIVAKKLAHHTRLHSKTTLNS